MEAASDIRKCQVEILTVLYNIPDADFRDELTKQQDNAFLAQIKGEYAQAYSKRNSVAIELNRLGVDVTKLKP